MNTRRPYIDFVSDSHGKCGCRYKLDDNELREIGEFTRENISRWMDNRADPPRADLGLILDMHAVCGDIDIPWATEDAKQFWEQLVTMMASEGVSGFGWDSRVGW